MSDISAKCETWPGRIIRLDQVDSTQESARALLNEGVEPEFAVVASEQSAGRGRLGRSWFSRRDLGLYCTVSVLPTVPPEEWPQLTLVMAVAAADAVERVSGISLQIKWPNDFYYEGRKVGGILAETVAGENGGWLAALVGIGINVGHAEEDFPMDLAGKVDSLNGISGKNVDIQILFDNLMTCFQFRLEQWQENGFAPVRRAWLGRDCTIGKLVTRGVDGEKWRVMAIGPDGCLIVEDSLGKSSSIICDDIYIVCATEL